MPVSDTLDPTSDTVGILIADDEIDTCELFAEFARAHGMRVATAYDGRAAISALERSPQEFSIVVTDLQMPGADGFEVLRAARAINPHCHVVMITGYATIDTAVRAVREGAYDYLAKPFALGQLEVVLRRIRDRIALEAENRALARQVSERPPTVSTRDVMDRFDKIDTRLATIERLLRDRVLQR
jgi:DNA-binding NtrC family response regulator